MSASAPGSRTARTNADTRSSAPRSSRISSTTARYSTSSSRVLRGGGVSSGRSSTSTRRRPSGIGLGGAEHAAVEAGEGDRLGSAGQPDALDDLGDGADRRVLRARACGTSTTLLVVADVGGERDVHAREDDDVFEWDEQ